MRKTIVLSVFLAAAFLAAAADYAGASELLPIGIEGERFVDSAGRQVIMRGIASGQRSKLPPFYPFDPDPDFEAALARFADTLDSMGFNAIRLLIMYEGAEPERGRYDEEYLSRYDRMVEAFAKRGFYVIVDSHQDLFSRRFCGDGFPDWALAERYRDNPRKDYCFLWEAKNLGCAVPSSFDRLWYNVDGLQDRYLEFFGMLAERYKDNPAVIGFEPINEPVPGFRGRFAYSRWYKKRLFAFYQRAADKIHEVDPRFIVFTDICPLENLWSWSARLPRPDIENLALAPHYYDLGYLGLPSSPGGGIETMQRGLAKHLKWADSWGVPAIVTEYGVSMQRDDAGEYIKKLYSVFDNMLLSGTIWEASAGVQLWNGRNKSIMDSDGTLRGPAYLLDRPYPRAVAGEIVSIGFSEDTKEFMLFWEEDGRVELPTVVYLPERLYGVESKFTLEPFSDYSFDEDENLLYVEPSAGGARHLKVMP